MYNFIETHKSNIQCFSIAVKAKDNEIHNPLVKQIKIKINQLFIQTSPVNKNEHFRLYSLRYRTN